MRKKIIAGNWKMNMNGLDAIKLCGNLIEQVKDVTNVDMVVCPPFTSIGAADGQISSSNVMLGAQNMSTEVSGAYTGEVSGDMLKNAGCEYVILGHSERREYFKEDDSFVNKKVKRAIADRLIPIICVGEKLEQRESGSTNDVVKKQLLGALEELSNDDASKIVIAYEPIWAIGTGKTATPEMAQEVHKFIRDLLTERFGDVAETIRIQYGGSMKPENAKELMSQPDIDGGLIGGASLKAESFAGIIKSASELE